MKITLNLTIQLKTNILLISNHTIMTQIEALEEKIIMMKLKFQKIIVKKLKFRQDNF